MVRSGQESNPQPLDYETDALTVTRQTAGRSWPDHYDVPVGTRYATYKRCGVTAGQWSGHRAYGSGGEVAVATADLGLVNHHIRVGLFQR